MNRSKFLRGLLSLSAVALLAACSTDNSSEESSEASSENTSVESSSDSSSMDHTEHMDDMMHDDSGEIPSGLKEAENPAYSVGDTVTLKSGHMEGMEGATATIESSENTTVYMIDYQPTTGEEIVKNHKWVTDSEVTTQ